MAKSWSDFFNWVLPHVPGCLQEVATDAIREAAIDFCNQTLVYRGDVTIDVVAAGTGLYDLSAPVLAQLGDQVEPLSVQDGKYNGVRLFAKTDGELFQLYGDLWDTTTGTPRYFNQFDEFTMRIAPISDTALVGGLIMSVALIPEKDSEEFDEAMWRSYHSEIANGAVAKLMMSVKKPYSNATDGAKRMAEFMQTCNTIAVHKKNNFTRRPLRSLPQYR